MALCVCFSWWEPVDGVRFRWICYWLHLNLLPLYTQQCNCESTYSKTAILKWEVKYMENIGFLDFPRFWLLAHPLPRSAVSKLDWRHRTNEKKRQLSGGRGGGGWRGAKSFDRKKAWYSIKHSMLSDMYCWLRVPVTGILNILFGIL